MSDKEIPDILLPGAKSLTKNLTGLSAQRTTQKRKAHYFLIDRPYIMRRANINGIFPFLMILEPDLVPACIDPIRRELYL